MIITQSPQEYLESYGIKPSLQRIAIMEFLMKNRIHPTVEEIYNALYVKVPTLSRTTVYNTLKLFAVQKAVVTLVIDDKNVRFDIDTSCHAHFQCYSCNRIFDVAVVDRGMLQQKQIGDLTITETHLYYKGYCSRCKA